MDFQRGRSRAIPANPTTGTVVKSFGIYPFCHIFADFFNRLT